MASLFIIKEIMTEINLRNIIYEKYGIESISPKISDFYLKNIYKENVLKVIKYLQYFTDKNIYNLNELEKGLLYKFFAFRVKKDGRIIVYLFSHSKNEFKKYYSNCFTKFLIEKIIIQILIIYVFDKTFFVVRKRNII